MPNIKIFSDVRLGRDVLERLASALPSLRTLICQSFSVDTSLCQIAIVEVIGLEDQAQLAVEVQLLPRADRTREAIVAASERLRGRLADVTSAKCAVRVAIMTPETYVVVR